MTIEEILKYLRINPEITDTVLCAMLIELCNESHNDGYNVGYADGHAAGASSQERTNW